jgi:hypothetical protein
MLTAKQLEKMSESAADEADKSRLADIREIKIDAGMPPEKRMKNYLEQIKNPYCFRCGDTVVRIRFEPAGEELGDKLKSFFISLKKA